MALKLFFVSFFDFPVLSARVPSSPPQKKKKKKSLHRSSTHCSHYFLTVLFSSIAETTVYIYIQGVHKITQCKGEKREKKKEKKKYKEKDMCFFNFFFLSDAHGGGK